jgi:hypothetical protein
MERLVGCQSDCLLAEALLEWCLPRSASSGFDCLRSIELPAKLIICHSVRGKKASGENFEGLATKWDRSPGYWEETDK